MAEPHPGEPRTDQARGKLGRLVVRKVPEAPRNAPFDAVGILAEREHLAAVVGLDERGVAPGEQADQVVRDAADVGRDADRADAVVDPRSATCGTSCGTCVVVIVRFPTKNGRPTEKRSIRHGGRWQRECARAG